VLLGNYVLIQISHCVTITSPAYSAVLLQLAVAFSDAVLSVSSN